MRTFLVSSDHRGLASIGRQNVCDRTMVCYATRDTYCELSGRYCNFELIERAGANVLGAMMSATAPDARGVHNRATG